MQKIERDIAEKKAHRKHYEDRRKIIEENIRTAEKDLNNMTRKVEVSSEKIFEGYISFKIVQLVNEYCII